MDIKTLKPAGQRDWSLVGIGAAAALIAFMLLTNRYSYQPVSGGDYTPPAMVRIDHWTGGLSRCVVSCIPMRDR